MNREIKLDSWTLIGMAGILISCLPILLLPGWRRHAVRCRIEMDPAYGVYQRYRYAYEKYGYLFSVAEEISGESGSGYTDREERVIAQSQDLVSDRKNIQKQEAIDRMEAEKIGNPNSAALNMAKLSDYDYLMSHYYSVHPSTAAPREMMNAERFLGTDLSMKQDPDRPQILIYHTHSQEEYADFGPGRKTATVVEAGNRLTELMRAKGWNVIHDTTAYDKKGGQLDRNRAYSYALEGITGILQKHPSIQLIVDLHRDGVGKNTRLVSKLGEKTIAKIMFFQGMSRTPEGEIAYLPNPYLKENLAFSFQLQCLAERYYPGLTRKIYMKGLRYNLHLRPRSVLVEAGAQTNTLEEVIGAMEPLAEVFDMVLRENTNNGIIYSE